MGAPRKSDLIVEAINEGRRTRDIAQCFGITSAYVSMLRRKSVKQPVVSTDVQHYAAASISPRAFRRMREEAAARKTSVEKLIGEILTVVGEDDLFKAVLD